MIIIIALTLALVLALALTLALAPALDNCTGPVLWITALERLPCTTAQNPRQA